MKTVRKTGFITFFVTLFALAAMLSFAVSAAETPNYLTFKALADKSSVSFSYVSGRQIRYSIDGSVWYYIQPEGVTVYLENKGDIVMFRGYDVKTDEDLHFSMEGRISASGDVTSLTNNRGGDAPMTEDCYYCMFKDCTALVSAPELPSTSLADYCYYGMFYGCTMLETAPSVIPAAEMAEWCCASMFRDCVSLGTVPRLTALILADGCYSGMFNGCTMLNTVPELPATELADYCYMHMFAGCCRLQVIPELNATVMKPYCYYKMFEDCEKLNLSKYANRYEWSIPADITEANNWCTDMFAGNNGDIGAAPEPGRTYYYFGSTEGLYQSKTPRYVPSVSYDSSYAIEQDISDSGTVLKCQVTIKGLINGLNYYSRKPYFCYRKDGENEWLHHDWSEYFFTGEDNTENDLITVAGFLGTNETGIYEMGIITCTGSSGNPAIDIIDEIYSIWVIPYLNISCDIKDDGVLISWDECPGALGYRLYVDELDVEIYAKNGIIKPSEPTEWKEIGSTDKTSYFYPVTEAENRRFQIVCYTRDSKGNIVESNVSFSLQSELRWMPAPTGLTAQDNGSGIKLSWQPSPDAYMRKYDLRYRDFDKDNPDYQGLWETTPDVKYYLERSEDGGETWATSRELFHSTAGIDETEYTDTDVVAGQTYTYRVKAEQTLYIFIKSIYRDIYYSPMSYESAYSEPVTFIAGSGITVITTANCRIDEPVAGETPSIRYIPTDSDSYISCLTGWEEYLADGSIVAMPEGATFEAGKRYRAKFYFDRTSGYGFTIDSEFFVNNMPADVYYYSIDRVQCSHEFYVPSYLTLTAEKAGSSVTFSYVSGENVRYSLNGGSWSYCPSGTTFSLPNAGDSVKFRGENIKTDTNNHFSMAGRIAAAGDITSLTNGYGFDVPLTASCYVSMFKGCTALTSAPNLPSTQLAFRCYLSMFEGCISLTAAPELPAESLAGSCYQQMFQGCTSLKSASVFHATYLETNSCTAMYRNCTGIRLRNTGIGKSWSVPSNASAMTDWATNMFAGTGGDNISPVPGKQYYYAFSYGDVDGDGVMENGKYATAADAVCLARYVAGWDVEIVPENSDIDCDDFITPRDVMILARSLAGWDGYGTLPYIN